MIWKHRNDCMFDVQQLQRAIWDEASLWLAAGAEGPCRAASTSCKLLCSLLCKGAHVYSVVWTMLAF
uniref:Uncharacterized protein n=1 Tax=Arundo donax TaxID=35708 RepID=A0A0A9D7Z1_ARUDO